MKVIMLVFVSIGFPFKGNIQVCLLFLAVAGISNEVFSNIPNIEREHEHFQLLPVMDAFMKNEVWRKGLTLIPSIN